MDLVLLGSHLKSDALTAEDYIRYIQVLLTGLAIHAVEEDPAQLRDFRDQIASITASLDEQSTDEDLLVSTGKALRMLAEYNQNAADTRKKHADELRLMLVMMTGTVAFLTATSETSVGQLQTIERKLQRASTLEDARQLRAQMADCLTIVRSESARIQSESKARLRALQAEVERVSSRLQMGLFDSSSDPVTGLPARAQAEKAIAAKIAAGQEHVVALFVVDRLAAINNRFGRATGDDILLLVAQQLAKRLSGSTLFRWSGPAILAIIEVATTVEAAENQAKLAGAVSVEKSVEAEERSVLLPIHCSCRVQRVSSTALADEVYRDLDRFTSSQDA
jgi:GGDEF domain-containing protein